MNSIITYLLVKIVLLYIFLKSYFQDNVDYAFRVLEDFVEEHHLHIISGMGMVILFLLVLKCPDKMTDVADRWLQWWIGSASWVSLTLMDGVEGRMKFFGRSFALYRGLVQKSVAHEYLCVSLQEQEKRLRDEFANSPPPSHISDRIEGLEQELMSQPSIISKAKLDAKAEGRQEGKNLTGTKHREQIANVQASWQKKLREKQAELDRRPIIRIVVPIDWADMEEADHDRETLIENLQSEVEDLQIIVKDLQRDLYNRPLQDEYDSAKKQVVDLEREVEGLRPERNDLPSPSGEIAPPVLEAERDQIRAELEKELKKVYQGKADRAVAKAIKQLVAERTQHLETEKEELAQQLQQKKDELDMVLERSLADTGALYGKSTVDTLDQAGVEDFFQGQPSTLPPNAAPTTTPTSLPTITSGTTLPPLQRFLLPPILLSLLSSPPPRQPYHL